MLNSVNSSWSFRDRCLLAAMLLASVVFIILRFGEFPVGAGMDDAYYIEMARSLAEGRGPVIHLNDSGPGWRPDIFPLGFPLLLSPLALLMPASVSIFKLVPLIALASLIPLCLLLVRPAGLPRGLVLTALVCLNPWMIAFATRVFSDLPFTAVSMAAVLLFWKLDNLPRPGVRLFAAVIILSGAGVMIRTIGLALPLAMIIHCLGCRQWRRSLILGGGVALTLLPHLLAGGGPGGGLITGAYLDQVLGGGAAATTRTSLVAGNLIGYLKELPVVLLPIFGKPLEGLAGRVGLGAVLGPLQLILGMALLAGMIRGLVVTADTERGRSRFLAIYLAIYAAALLNFAGYPSGVQARLLLPVLPLMYFLLLMAGNRLPTLRQNQLAWPAVILVLALSVGHNAYRSVRPLNGDPGTADRAFIEPGQGSDWIRNHTDPAEVIMARWPLRQHIHFLRPVVGFGTAGGGDFRERIARYQVRFVVLDSFGPPEYAADLRNFLQADPEQFPLVHHDSETGIRIFRVGTGP